MCLLKKAMMEGWPIDPILVPPPVKTVSKPKRREIKMGIEITYTARCDECRGEGPSEDTERAALSYGFKWIKGLLYCSVCAEMKVKGEKGDA